MQLPFCSIFLSGFDVGVESGSLVISVEQADRRGKFNGGGDIFISGTGSESGGAVGVQTVLASVGGADGDNDQFFGFGIKSAAGGFSDFQDAFKEIAVAAHDLKDFGQKSEILFEFLLDGDSLCHDFFERRGVNVYFEVPLSFTEAALGTEL